MKSKLIVLVTSLMLFAAMPSQASSLVNLGDNTYDPNTGLMWLDVTLTTNHSYNDVVANLLGVGQIYEGYRYATGAEIITLFKSAGINPYYYDVPNGNAPAVQALIDLLGVTYSDNNSQLKETYGLTADFTSPDSSVVYTALLYLSSNLQITAYPYSYIGVNYAASDFGSFLVATPLPSTWLMLFSGFAGLGFLSYRGTKKRTAALEAA
jgi:hypothetical protein